MDRLTFEFDGHGHAHGHGHGTAHPRDPVVVGVVASGNLEVLIESETADDRCVFEVATAAHGFDDVWAAVLADFVDRAKVASVRVSINDVGATPAVVSLRLDQAIEEFRGTAALHHHP
jgi:malonate decarboxylase delta subunit